MKKHHTTFILLTLFFTGLIALWWADYADIPTADERLKMKGLVLPALLDVRPADVRRLEIDRGTEGEGGARRLVFERRGEDRWQMLEPVDTMADPGRLDAMVRNLKDLPRSPEAGTLHEPAASYGLEPPSATIRVFKADAKAPLATIELGKVVRDRLYVRPGGQKGIEVVDARPFQGIGGAVPGWRDRAVFNLPSFRVASVSVAGPGRDLKLERVEERWKITHPIRALADEQKVEGVVAELAALHVAGEDKGFVADDVRDFKPFGLDPPAMTIEMTPAVRGGKPQVLRVGSAAPGDEGRLYARRGDEDDVILIEGRGIHDLGTRPNALRSQNVADIAPDRVDRLEIAGRDLSFTLAKGPSGWEVMAPAREKADAPTVEALLSALAGLQASEFFEAKDVPGAGVESPGMTIKVWQSAPGAKAPAPSEAPPKGDPRLVLRLGTHDGVKKTIWARVEGDPAILALPDIFLNVLPKNRFAFRERTVLDLDPARVARLELKGEDGSGVALEPETKSARPNRWRMVKPVEASANDEAVTRALMVLKGLRAEDFVPGKPDDKELGLDKPSLTVSWTTQPIPSEKGSSEPKTGSLRVGNKVPKSESRYAALEGDSAVFTLPPAALSPFRAEFHDTRVLAFQAKQAERVVLRWKGRTLALRHRPDPRRGAIEWVPEPGQDASGFDLSRIGPLVNDLSKLTVGRFYQYGGPIPASAGLAEPNLVIEVQLVGNQGTRTLRVGNLGEGGAPIATTGDGREGPVFLLVGAGWADLLRYGAPAGELPENVFAPDRP
jgi:hypothetical protein